MRWEVTHVGWHRQKEREALLAEGWEPFAVTEDDRGATIWLRRPAA